MQEYKLKPIKFLWQLLNKSISEAKVYILGYRSYIAILDQSGTTAPVATVLENTLGSTFKWNYAGVGKYYVESIGTFTPNKTVVITGTPDKPGFFRKLITSVDSIDLQVFATNASLIDNNLAGTYIEIRVYN